MYELNILLFLTASVALILSPGPDNIYVLTRGVAQGRVAALVSALGVSTGLVMHTSLAALGLSALLQQSATAFQVVKYVGAAYLIYLGIKMILSREDFSPAGGEARRVEPWTVFRQGLASNVLNPKVAVFFLAFLPQFVSPAAGGAALQLLALGLAFALLALGFLALLAYFAGSAGEWLRRRPGLARLLRWASGSVLAGLGVRLALSERG